MRQSARLSTTIENLRPRFLEQTAERLDRFRRVRAALDRPGRIEAELTEIRFGAHKTTGIAATLGFATLGRAAQDLDAALTPLADKMINGPLPADLVGLVDALMEEMAQVGKAKTDGP